MQCSSAQWFVLAALASLQAISAIVLMAWAFPLFADPPLLANGVSHRAYELDQLLASTSAPSPVLKGMAEHYRWLFWRHMEGVEATLGAAVALLGSSAVTFAILLSQPRRADKRPSTGT
ncbi:MAG: hypothetical protein EON58_12520 [Alphaproteobacteria bacterium]|nr:MAG: hypothetical protein EON58_12520 [Alphaproteobacteria bacterium]